MSGRPSPIKKKETTEQNSTVVQNKQIKEKAAPQEKKPAQKVVEKEVVVEEAPASKSIIKDECVAEKIHTHSGKTMLTDLDNHTCRWPLGDPKDENFHFCGKKVRIGQTYCDEHANIAYVKANKK